MQSNDIDWLQLIISGNLSAEEQRDLWKITERFIVKTAPKLRLY